MAACRVAPYGSWESPITAELIARATVRLRQIALDGEDVYWIESQPTEGGRYVIVRRTPDGRVDDVTPPPFYARTRVHEYGGGDFVAADGVVYFSNFADQRLYRLVPGRMPQPLTPAVDLRYADGVLDRRRNRLICVREDHTAPGRQAVNTLVSINLETGGAGQVLASGNDFYSSPRLSPDGQRLAWLTWNHPNMPWDGCELWVGDLRPGGAVARAQCIAGGPSESIFQPEWSPDGVLHFVSDRTGWWNLYRWRGGQVEPLCEMPAEFGQAQWGFGMSTYGFASPSRIICTYEQDGTTHLASLDTASGHLEPIATPYTMLEGIRVGSGWAVFRGGSPSEPVSLALLDLDSGRTQVLRRSSEVAVDPGYLSQPQPIEFPTEGGQTAYALYYPPKNRDLVAPAGELPPLRVYSHGGPTGAATTAFDLSTQFWTSRGFAVLDVNYGGSTGYGRAYRERLKGRWGIVDVDDCVNAARFMVERGLADERRLVITGGSAGGYTTLAALTFRKAFKAGASYYGIGDLEALARDTHKFESHYLDGLVGPYPERRDLYVERSPLHHVERLSCPVIFFQGLEDQVVPPNQAEMMVDALRAKRVPVAYVTFAGEQHGFRRAESIRRSLEGELYFYSRVFGFELPGPVEPVAIENL